MALSPRITATPASRRVKLDTLVGLRWLAIAGQATAIVVIGIGLRFPMPMALCFALVALSAWLNVFLRFRFPPNLRLPDTQAAALLAYDILQVSGLLYLTGGLENPFAILILVPVMVSATTLSPRHTVALGVLVVLVSSLLAISHEPLPWPPGERLDHPLLYILGVWVALLCALMFMGAYTFRVAAEARELSDALGATELVLAREHHLSALDGLAAAAAHELGTPLATIALVAKELARELPPDSPHREDVALLISQSQRCREILATLTARPDEADWPFAHQPLTHLLNEAADRHRDLGVEVVVSVDRPEGAEPVGRRNPATLYGLSNLIENAVDFAASRVDVTASWSPSQVTVTIADDGPGFSPGVIDRIGEPYVTTRAAPGNDTKPDAEGGGLGLGFFIAKTLLERSGGRLELANRSPPRTGAVIRIRWPRAAYDALAAGPDPELDAPAAWRGRQETI